MIFFCFIAGPQSVHKTAQYEKLAQDASDNEEEDDVLFHQDGISSKQNGFTKPRHERLARNQVKNQHETIEMNSLHQTSEQTNKLSPSTPVPSGDVKVRLLRSGLLSRTRIACFVLSIILCLGFTFMFTLVFPYVSHNGNKVKLHHKTPSWTKSVHKFGKY